jgi:haloalkane dehalogenase
MEPVLRAVEVLGRSMSFRECGNGDPIVFLHGNPTSSYLWRHVMGKVSHLGRCVAPDLLGMGGSAKAQESGDDGYRFAVHRQHLDALLELLGVSSRVTFVGHDWGAVLATDWARRHPERVRRIAYMETLVAPVNWTDDNAPDPVTFRALRSPRGEQMVLEDNFFVEKVLPAGTSRRLSDVEMAEYRTPYSEAGESRRPTLTWAREIPIDGEPQDVYDIVAANGAWMESAQIPKLFVNGDPGALLTGRSRELCRRWPNQTEVTVPGLHFLPEDSPEQIADALASWLAATRTPAT